MAILRDETFPIRSSDDIVKVRQMTREWALMQAFSLVDQTKIVTAASELARNTLEHGRGGEVRIQALDVGQRRGGAWDSGSGESVARWSHDRQWHGPGPERLEAPRE